MYSALSSYPAFPGSFHGILRFEDLRQFPQSPVVGLWPKEVNDSHLDEVPEDKHQVEVVLDVGECGTRTVLDNRTTD
jgi:hypothetical protein